MAKSRRNNGSRRNKTRRKQNPFMMFMKKFRKENKGLSFKDMGREGGKAFMKMKMKGGGDGDEPPVAEQAPDVMPQ